jgi:KDO2-lipid IV(A) lauroyltransferase
MPVGHARLALKTGARILIGATTRVGPAQYRVHAPKVVEPEVSDDREQDVKRLSQRILGILEDQIRARPDEWLMFFPVWPDKIPVPNIV